MVTRILLNYGAAGRVAEVINSSDADVVSEATQEVWQDTGARL